jgi:hypothetical protein
MSDLKRLIYIYTGLGNWKHVNKHDMPKHKGHAKPQFRNMTPRQIDRLLKSNTKL